jgi:hypothetical protein
MAGSVYFVDAVAVSAGYEDRALGIYGEAKRT